MEIRVLKEDGRIYISLTDFAREYYNEYNKIFNISLSTKNIPEVYLIKGRGRNSNTYMDTCILPLFLSTKRTIPKNFINKILRHLDKQYNRYNEAIANETFFIDILENFLLNILPKIKLVRQFTIKGKVFDLCIDDKILIEFDEVHHRNTVKNDNIKDEIAEQNNYKLIRINSNINYGRSLARIYKKIKLSTL